MQAMNPSLSFSLDERTVAALLQEDESTFNMLGSLLPSAASAALAAAEAQHHGDGSALQAANAAAMHHLLQLHAGQVSMQPALPQLWLLQFAKDADKRTFGWLLSSLRDHSICDRPLMSTFPADWPH